MPGVGLSAAVAGALLQRAELASGVELHFVELGSGPPMLLLHGGMGDCRSWDAQLRPFAERFRVLAYSRRHSSPNRNPITPHSVEVDIEDLNGFLQHLRIGSAHLVGTSYGALVALAYALKQPENVLSLVMAEPPLHRWACRTPAGAELYAAFMRGVWHPAGAAFALGCDRFAVQLLIDGMWGSPIFESLPSQRQNLALRNAASMRLHTQASDPFPSFPRDSVNDLATPSLLVCGERSSALHRCVMEELVGAIPFAARVVIADAGHGSPSEQPEAFNAAVLRFLARSAPESTGAVVADSDGLSAISCAA